MTKCPDISTLKAFARDELGEDEAHAVEQHAQSCKRCAQELAALPFDDELLADISTLEESRRDIAPAVEEMRSRHKCMTTTLFGDINSDSNK